MKKIVFLILCVVFALVAEDINASAKKWEVKPIKPKYSIKFDKNTTCKVRKIAIYKYPKWVSKIELSSSKTVYFCSPKSMFEFYFHPALWPEMGIKKEEDFVQIVVTDYNTLKAIDAKSAYFVYGSNIISPAGDDLVAFGSEEEAKKFAKKYNGKRVFSFSQVKDALIRYLNGKI